MRTTREPRVFTAQEYQERFGEPENKTRMVILWGATCTFVLGVIIWMASS